MKIRTGSQLFEIGQRLFLLRNELGYTRTGMAQKLSLKKKTYYKHEVGLALPCFETLHRLQTEFDISMDWLLFKNGPVRTKERQTVIVEEKKTTNLENKFPDATDLLTAMEHDNVLLHEIMLYFYKYKQNKEARETTIPTPLA
jgi:DNA-binding XRE family transcriptional regulator